MINHKHRFVFIHVPKTGGTSLEMAFGYSERNRHIKHLNEQKYSELLGNIFLEYKKIPIIRNPWDRALSFYFYRKLENRLNDKINSFTDWVYYIKNKKGIFEGIYDYLLNDDSICCDIFLNFCNLEEDFNNFCKSQNISLKLPHINKTKHKHYTEYYNDETKQIVAEKYAKDIEYFNFEFGE